MAVFKDKKPSSVKKRKPGASGARDTWPARAGPGEAAKETTRGHKPVTDALHAAAFHLSPSPMFAVSLPDRQEIFNPAFCRMLGYSSRALTRTGLDAVTHADDPGLSSVLSAPGRKKIHHVEKTFVHKSGRPVRARIGILVIRDGHGIPSVVVGQGPEAAGLKGLAHALANYKSELARQIRYRMIIRKITRAVHRSLKVNDVIRYAVRMIRANIAGADIVGIHMVEGNEAVLKGDSGYEEEFRRVLARIPHPRGFTWKTLIEGKMQYRGDTSADKVIGPAGLRMGTKSYVSMPIRDGGKTVGCINVNSRRKHAFGPEELSLLRNIAQHIALAISNARKAEDIDVIRKNLDRRVQVRTAELSRANAALQSEISARIITEKRLVAINRISKILAAETFFRDAAPKILDAVCRSLDVELSEFWEPAGTEPETFVCTAYKSTLKGDAADKFASFTRAAAIGLDSFQGHVFTTGRHIWISDMASSPLFKRKSMVSELGLCTGVAFPIFTDGRVTGIMSFFAGRKIIPGRDLIDMIGALGRDIGLFMVKTRAVEALRESETRFRTMADSAPVLIWMTGKNDFGSWFNKTWLEFRGKTLGEEMDRGWLRGVHPEDAPKCAAAYEESFESTRPFETEFRLMNAAGEYRWVSSRGVPVFSGGGELAGFIGSCADIHELKLSQQFMKEQLTEQEFFLREIHHRVKNNLQMVFDLLEVRHSSLDDERAKKAIKESLSHILAIARIHKRLYQAENLGRIDLGLHIKSIIRDILNLYSADSTVVYNLKLDGVAINIDKVLPLGLIVNELVSNALVHAFSNEKKGKLRVGLVPANGGKLELTIRDDGSGFPPGFDLESQKTMGLRIVSVFTHQLGGELRIRRMKKGTEFKIIFDKS